MGSVKRFLEQVQADEERHEWIEENVDFNVVPGDPEWIEMDKQYEKRLMEGSLSELANGSSWLLEEEIEWSKTNPHSVAYQDFCNQTERLDDLMGDSPDPMQQKIRFSYVVTLMESCLSEMLKSITLSSEELKGNALTNVHGLKDSTIKVNQLLNTNSNELIEKTIINYLASLIYHNIVAIINVYQNILNVKFEKLEGGILGKIKEATTLRHDIVHRNGKKASGEENDITKEIIDGHIENINTLIDVVYEYINVNIPQEDEPEF